MTNRHQAKQALMPTGMCMGDSMFPLPENLCRKILNFEYIEMADLSSEAWMLEEEFTNKTLAALFKRRKEPITDILVWVQFLCLTSGSSSTTVPYTDFPIYGLPGNHRQSSL